MITNLQQPDNVQTNTSLLNDITDNNTHLALPVSEDEIANQLKERLNLPGVCAMLPHHCIQLCFLS